MPNEKLIEVFKDTMHQCKRNVRLKADIKHTMEHSVVFNPSLMYPKLQPSPDHPTQIVVTGKRTFEAAETWKSNRVAVLNFADAIHPGGGVKWGSSAQEESLCRCSTLYPVLDTPANHILYYQDWSNDCRYSDKIIWTPGVTVFKSDGSVPHLRDEPEWYKVDVITCAAPNLREHSISNMELYGIHVKRAVHIMTVAALFQTDVLILGAFGCGAFRNNPEIVAQAYRDVVKQFDGYFYRIEFAVYDSKFSNNKEVFQKYFRM